VIPLCIIRSLEKRVANVRMPQFVHNNIHAKERNVIIHNEVLVIACSTFQEGSD